MKKKLFFTMGVLSCFLLSAQEVVSSQGDSYTNGEVGMDFSLGEPMIATLTNGPVTLTQGFHQPHFEVLKVEDHEPNFEATIYPNPLKEVLHIQVNQFEQVTYEVYDQLGKFISRGKLTGEKTPIQVGHLALGSYFLILNHHKQRLKTFKLIKNF